MTIAAEPFTAAQPAPLAAGLRKTLILASLGGALEFYDFIVFVFFADVIGRLFFPPDVPDWVTQLEAFAIFGVGYFARPLGGVVMAHFGDKFGRKRIFMLSVFMMALPTLLIGCLPVYADIGYLAPVLLALMRVLQGAAIGGEAPGAWVFVSEHAGAQRTGLACGLLASGLVAGILLGSIVSTAIHAAYSTAAIASFAWRFPFLLGGFLGFVAIYLRQWLNETPIFQAMQARSALERSLPLKIVWRHHPRAIAISMALTWMLAAITTVVILMAPGLIRKLDGVPALVTFYSTDFATFAYGLSALLTGIMIDRFGTRRVAVILGPIMIAAVYGLFSPAAANPDFLLAISVLAGFGGGLSTLVPVTLMRGFPAAIRFSGASFSYNVAYAIAGGVTPVLVQAWSLKDRFGPAHYVALCVVIGIVATLISIRSNLLASDNAGF
ncbi:MFS transporter [Bradyrhizobium sp. Ai1a-2]|uniref:MFS transporter n=1 Tax=Bradyrhizobium sp. Ai1a-2 TaxID=196490 RepID=UPI0003F92470|nr:MFS transporter [Bradyrhizobium sp. Ai1a-2]